MIKIAAAAITIISGVSLGASLSQMEKSRIAQLEELRDLIFHIYKGIESLSMPLGEIFDRYFKENPHSLLKQNLSGHRGTHGEKIMFLASSLCSEKLCGEIKGFTETLGKLDRDTQIKMSLSALSSMETETEERKKEYHTKCRLYKTLSTLISCVTAVLLY